MTRNIVVGLSAVFVVFLLSSMALAGAMYYGDPNVPPDGSAAVDVEGGNLFPGPTAVNAVRVRGGTELDSWTMNVYDVATTPPAGLSLLGTAEASGECWAEFVPPLEVIGNVLVTVVGPAEVPTTTLGSPEAGWFANDWVTLSSIPAAFGYTVEAVSGMRGDVNDDGTVNVADAMLAIDIVLEEIVASVFQSFTGDMDGNCDIDVGDVKQILQAWTGGE
jgi:hypothetical protein